MLNELYAAVPAVDCIPGCTDCCGKIPLPLAAERRAFGPSNLMENAGGVWMSKGNGCRHGRKGNCAIHDRRPFMCRLFGTVDIAEVDQKTVMLACPHGRKPKVALSNEQVAELTRRYFELVAAEAKKQTADGREGRAP